MPNITLNNISKCYVKGHAPAVDQVSMEVADGAFMCVLGPSGCGKSTILRMIAGLENLTDGDISVAGKSLDNVSKGIFIPPEKRHIGLVFQSYALWPHMTVARNIEFGLKLKRMPAKERKQRVAEMVSMLKIEGLEERYPAQLSGGQQQRVALARTLAMNPGVLLLDEPLSNLDAALRLSMRAELTRLHKEFGTTIVFVTHDQWEAMTLATQIAVMNKGTLQQIGTPDDIYERPANRFVAEFIGNPPINMLPADSDAAQHLMQAADLIALPDVPHALSEAQLGLRPEGLQLSVDASGNGLPVFISDILPTGGAWIIELQAKIAQGHQTQPSNSDGQITLIHTTQTPPLWRKGQSVFLQAAPHAMHLFTKDGERQSLLSNLKTTAFAEVITSNICQPKTEDIL